MNNKLLFKLIERLGRKGWRGILENARRLLGLLMKAQLCVFGGLSKQHCLGILCMSREIIRIYRKSGPLFLGQYLKHVSFMLMWYVGGDLDQRPPMKTFVSLTRSGIPRFIPPFYRKLLRRNKDPKIIQLVLTVCSLHKLLTVVKRGGMRVNPQTIHQKDYSPGPPCMKLCVELLTRAHAMLSAYAPMFLSLPLRLGFRFKPSFSSGPNTYKKPEKESMGLRFRSKGKQSMTVYHSLPIDASALLTLIKPEDLAGIGAIWYHDRDLMVESGFDAPVVPLRKGTEGLGWLINSVLASAHRTWWPSMKTRPELGRFGRKIEGAGKIRLFAIANPILQALVRPLHDWVMQVLKSLKTDGTYNQLAPLLLLKGKKELYSFDLKSATDLMPIDLSGSMLAGLMGDHLAQTWVQVMSLPGFRTPDRITPSMRAMVYRFTRGQPLGYYSSWPVFTLTHHMLVWYCAWLVYPGKRFFDYAILGDDIVIADRRVAEMYKQIAGEAEVVISVEKSLVSSSGCFEFAKRFVIDNHLSSRADVSPISLKVIRTLYGFVSAFVFKSLGVNLQNSFRLRGASYRVYSRVRPYKLVCYSRRWLRHWLCMHSPSGIHPLPIKLWLAFPEKGCLTCYEMGWIRFFILEQTIPRDLEEQSFDELREFWDGDPDAFLERLLRPIIELHLESWRWYTNAYSNYTIPWEDLLSPPVSVRSIRRSSEDKTLGGYGLLFRCWDKLRTGKAVSTALPGSFFLSFRL